MATTSMAQEIITCGMCETSPVKMYCNSCAANLCNDCLGKHVSAEIEKDHNIVIFKKKNTKPIFPSCKTHKDQTCEMKCQQCDTPVCVNCVTLGSHKKHELLGYLTLFNFQKDTIKQKTTELEKQTYPQYEKAVSDLEIKHENLTQTYDKLISKISNQGEEWHREVDVIITKQKQEVEKMKTNDLATLKKLLEEMKNLLSTLHQAIRENNDIVQSADVTEVLESKYTSPEMWDPLPNIDVTLPTFIPLPIQGKQLHQMFGTLTPASMPHSLTSVKLIKDKFATAVEQVKLLDSAGSTCIHTAYQYGLMSIACLDPDQFWVSGHRNSEIKRFTVSGSLQETVNTRTGNMPRGITVTKQGNLIYTDYNARSINKVRHGKIEKIISLQQDWRPITVCCTNLEELLVTMEKPSTPSRVVRYSGSTEKQVIQSDDQGKPLFSIYEYLFLAENSDKDIICVSDLGTNTVVVVNQAGKLRFRYKGNFSQTCKSFSPRGVVIDITGNILVADYDNNCIHKVDQQGHFISYIGNWLSQPQDLSLCRNNTLVVAAQKTDKVTVIKYLN